MKALGETAHKRKGVLQLPPSDVLISFFNTLFYASIKTEEGRSIQVRVFYMDPSNPDPDVPMVIRADRWKVFPFKIHFPFTVANLVKFAKAADSWSSGIAVFHNNSGELFVWGLVDQVVSISMAIVQESSATYSPPGLFHALINGPADITVFQQMSFVARMAQDAIIEKQNDCLWEGFVSDLIDRWIAPIWKDVRKTVGEDALSVWEPNWKAQLKHSWTSTLARILINIQRQRHGGAVLFTSAENDDDLSIKYELDYSKVAESIKQSIISSIEVRNVRDILEWRKLEGKKSIPPNLHSREHYYNYHRDDAERALTGAVRFISSMAGVDGLVLLSSSFCVKGFGVEITTKREVPEIFIAASTSDEIAISGAPNHFGTRHRSMFRFCYTNPGTLGFVVSQDGDIRAVTNIKGKLVLFENVKVHSFWDDDFHKMFPSTKSAKSRKKADAKPTKSKG